MECEDEETRCQQTFDYSRHPQQTSTCTFDQTKQLDDPFVLANDTKICYRVLDMNGNQYNDSEFIKPPYARGINETCDTNADCESNYCSDEGVCEVASCDDGLQNGWQTDVDCGGPKDNCPRCQVGDSCKENRDCAAGLQCKDGTCQERQCLNVEQQCGGECGPCPTGAECEVPSDCETRNCEDGVCVEPEEETPGDPGDPEDPSDPGEETSEDGISTVGLLLLVLGLLFMLAGGGLIGYSEYYIKGGSSSTKSFKPGNIAGSKRQSKKRTKQEDKPKKSSISRDKINKAKRKSASKRRKAKRRQLLDEFDVSKDKSLKEKVKDKKEETDTSKKDSTKTTSETSKKSKDTSSKTEKSNKQKKKDKSSKQGRSKKKSNKKDSKSDENEEDSAMDRLKEFNQDNDE